MRVADLLARAGAADQRIFDRVSRTEIPVVGPLLRPLSRIADKSVLWGLIAMGLGATSGRRGRRAALRGTLSIGAASLITNQPAKRLFRRARPSVKGFPVMRLVRTMPTSTSFPSGHSASAFAFAVGAGAELPRAGRLPLLALAGTVAFSRVYVGAHYPGDVVVGASVGALVGRASTRVWPLPAVPPGAGPVERTHAQAPASPDGAGLALVVNPDAGSELDPAHLAELFPAARIIERREDQDIVECLEEAARGATPRSSASRAATDRRTPRRRSRCAPGSRCSCCRAAR
jgi:undecaprenyl-diphosphatase